MILRARFVAPMDGPVIEDGAVLIEGSRIQAIGSRRDLSGEPVEDLGEVILLPGFINAHAHLELSVYAGRLSPSSLWTWLVKLVRLRRRTDPRDERAGAVDAAQRALHNGVTCVADISRKGDTWAALRGVPIRKICFAELISLAKEPPREPAELAKAVDAVEADALLAAGVSPHAPYTVSAEHFTAAVDLARQKGVPLTTHWAETREERRWLARGGGALGAMIRGLGGGGMICSPRCGPIAYADRLGLLSAGALLAHVNYIDDQEILRLAGSPASVVYCPRSHRFFGHSSHRWREMLDAGVNVCVGTDSTASLPSGAAPSILEELRFLQGAYPEVSADLLVSMGTIRAARALGLGERLGSITPGKEADLVAVPLRTGRTREPLAHVLASDRPPCGVWLAGRQVVR